MKTFWRFCWFALLLFILFFIMVALSGCGGKKKLVQKEKYTTEIAKVERVNELVQTDVKTDTETNTGSETITTNENENVEADIADPEKDFSLTKETKDGTTTWTGKNIKNLKTATEKGTAKTKDTTATKEWVEALSKTVVESESKTEASASGSSTNIDIEKQGKFPWWWILVALVVYGVVSYFRGLNPLKWF